MSAQKRQLFKYSKILIGFFSVVTGSIYNFEETCILLELPFHAKMNGLCPSSV